MKDYFKEIFELFANCLMILTLALSVFPVDWLRKYILKKKGIAIRV